MDGPAQRRDLVAVVVTADGRRLPVRAAELPLEPISILRRLGLVALELISLIRGSRREPGGRRG